MKLIQHFSQLLVICEFTQGPSHLLLQGAAKIMLILLANHSAYISLNIFISLKKFLFHFKISSQQHFYIALDIVLFCCLSIRVILAGNVLLLVSSVHILHVDGWLFARNQLSVGLSSVSNTYPIQFNLVLPIAIVDTFSFYNTWFNVVQLTSIFPFAFPL